MQLEQNEYIVNKNMGDETITITRKALEEWRDHYDKVVQDVSDTEWQFGFYLGKSEVLTELLQHFEQEGEE